jgi:hypothetical protein
LDTRRLGLLASLILSLAACGGDNKGTTVGPVTDGDGDGDGDGDEGDGDDDEGEEKECDNGPKQDCQCDDGSDGTQYCNTTFGSYSECDCGGDGDNGLCKAGYYTGEFKGKWRPGQFDLGGGATLVTADISAMGTAEKPGLALTLEEKAETGGEFPTYEVKNGCVVGTATAFGFDSHPFVAAMTGELDCKTGKFSGVLDGKYYLFNSGKLSEWFFMGPLTADFTPEGAELDNGEWDMREKQAKPNEDPGAGGEGTWGAAWKSAEGPALPPECLELINGGGSDAGVGDAG